MKCWCCKKKIRDNDAQALIYFTHGPRAAHLQCAEVSRVRDLMRRHLGEELYARCVKRPTPPDRWPPDDEEER